MIVIVDNTEPKYAVFYKKSSKVTEWTPHEDEGAYSTKGMAQFKAHTLQREEGYYQVGVGVVGDLGSIQAIDL